MDLCRKGILCRTNACNRIKKTKRMIFFKKLLTEFFLCCFFQLLLLFGLQVFYNIYILQTEKISSGSNGERIKICTLVFHNVINSSNNSWWETSCVLARNYCIAKSNFSTLGNVNEG